MLVFRAGHSQFGWLLGVSLLFSAEPAVGQGYTPEQEQACTADAFRLCSSEIPDVGRVTACMVAKKSQLSPPCRAQFRPDPEPSDVSARTVGRPTAIRPVAPREAASAKPASAKAVNKAVSNKARKPKKPANAT